MEIIKGLVLQFEYKFWTYYGSMEEMFAQNILNKENTSIEYVFNELGKDGWELFTILQGKENCLFIFKRSKWVEKKAQEKQEGQTDGSWSEEDENNLTDTCVAIRKFYHGTNGAQELIDWLKSLKQRCTWKPSDKQIMALRWVLNNIPYNTHKEEISGLIEQIQNI